MVDVAKLSISISTVGAKTAAEELVKVRNEAQDAEAAVKELGKIDADAFNSLTSAISGLGTGLEGIAGVAKAFANFGDTVTRPLGKLNSALQSLGGASKALDQLRSDAEEANLALLELATAPVDEQLKTLATNIGKISKQTSNFSAKSLNADKLRTTGTAFGTIGTKALTAAESIELFGEFVRSERKTLEDFSTNATTLATAFDSLVASTRRLRRVSKSSLKGVKEISNVYGELGKNIASAFTNANNLTARLNAINESQDKVAESGREAATSFGELASRVGAANEGINKYRETVGGVSRAQKGVNQRLKNGVDAYGQVAAGANGAAAATNRTKKSFNALQDTARRTNNFLKQFATGLGVIGGGFAVARAAEGSIGTLFDYEFALQQVRAVAISTNQTLGEQESQFQSLSAQARELGATTRFTATQTAEAQLFLARAGFEVNEILEATPATLNLAAAGVLDLGEAADIASNVLQQFSLNASQLGDVTDDLVSAANSSNTTVRQLADALNYAGPFAASLGLRVQDAAAAVGALGNAGIKSSLAGTNLRGILISLLKPSKQAAETLDKLAQRTGQTADVFDVTSNSLADIFQTFKDASASAEDFATVFNRRNVSGAQALTAQVKSLEELQAILSDNADEAQRTANIVDDSLRGAFKRAVSAVQEFVLATGDAGAKGALRGFLDTATETFRILAGITTVTEETSGSVLFLKDALIALAGAAVAVTATAITSFLVSIATTAATAATAAGGLAASLGAVATAFPPLAIAGVVGAVGALTISFAKSKIAIRNFVEEADAIRETFDLILPSAEGAKSAVEDFFALLEDLKKEGDGEIKIGVDSAGAVISSADRLLEKVGKVRGETEEVFKLLQEGRGTVDALPVNQLPDQILSDPSVKEEIANQLEDFYREAFEQVDLEGIESTLFSPRVGGFRFFTRESFEGEDPAKAFEVLQDQSQLGLKGALDELKVLFSEAGGDAELGEALFSGIESSVLKFATEGFGERLVSEEFDKFANVTEREVARFNSLIQANVGELSDSFLRGNFEQVVTGLVRESLQAATAGRISDEAVEELVDALVSPLDLAGEKLEATQIGEPGIFERRFLRASRQLRAAFFAFGDDAVESAESSLGGLPSAITLPFEAVFAAYDRLSQEAQKRRDEAANNLTNGDLVAELQNSFDSVVDKIKGDIDLEVEVSGLSAVEGKAKKEAEAISKALREAGDEFDIDEDQVEKAINELTEYNRTANQTIADNKELKKSAAALSDGLKSVEEQLQADIDSLTQRSKELEGQLDPTQKLTSANKEQFELQKRLLGLTGEGTEADKKRRASIEDLVRQFIAAQAAAEALEDQLKDVADAEKAFASARDSLVRGITGDERRADNLRAQIEAVRGLTGELAVQAEFERRLRQAQKDDIKLTSEQKDEIFGLVESFIKGKESAAALATQLREIKKDDTLLTNLRQERLELGLQLEIAQAGSAEQRRLAEAKLAAAKAGKLSAFATEEEIEEATKLNREIEALNDLLGKSKARRDRLTERQLAGAQVNAIFAQNLTDVILAAKSAEEAFAGFVDQVIRLIVQQQILNSIEGFGEKLFGGLLTDNTGRNKDSREAEEFQESAAVLEGAGASVAGSVAGAASTASSDIASGGISAGTILLKAAAALKSAAAALAASGFSLSGLGGGIPFGTSIPGVGTVLGPGIGDPTGGSFFNPFQNAMGNAFGDGGNVVRRFALGGIPPLGGLPTVGSDPALFRTPDGRLNSIREGGKPEAILPLGRDSNGRLGVRIAGDTRGGGATSNTTNNVTQVSNYSVSTNPDSFGMNERQLQRRMRRGRR